MKKEIIPVQIDSNTIKEKIYFIRGQKVMLDKDLAEIYGYEVKRFNEQVNRNIDRFDEDFMFKLTQEEYEILKSQFATSSWGGSRKIPNAFTEQGIYMLMTVLKNELAVKQSKALIRLFKSLKDFVSENRDLIPSKNILQIESRTSKLETTVDEMRTDLNKVMSNFIDKDSYKHFLILDGKKLEADMAYSKIYKTAKKSIYYIDNYVGLKTLDLLSNAKNNIDITIFSDNVDRKPIKQYMVDDFKIQNPTNSISLKKTNGKYHDRYIVVDYATKNETIYHCGASSKDAGNKITTISKIEDVELYKQMINELLSNPDLKI